MSLERRSIGIVEDDPIMGESLVQRLTLEGAKVTWWRDGASALAGIGEERRHAVICDIRLPDLNGEDVFKAACGFLAPPFLFITGHADIDQAVRLMRSGAGDYVTKPFEMEDFFDRLSGIVSDAPTADGSLGVSPAMREVEALLRRVAKVGSTVLIGGETGTGKEVAARFLHSAASFDPASFMGVNCAAIPADLLESELFGHERGAFSGATRRHAGYVERAAGGTLFLDEIAEMRIDLQAKLLRLIEERTYTRVGGEQPLRFEGRMVAATNADLGARVKEGRFREDLFYRINVVSVRMPPLRERRDDVPWLLDRAFAEFAARSPDPPRGLSAMAEEAALAHDWPGNVRELRNRVERATALALGPWIRPADLFPEHGQDARAPHEMPSLEEARLALERRHITRALQASGGEIGAAARLLGLGRTTLWEKMRRLGLKPAD
ncbi:acetoacetate metabolism regulatory protein AtoC [Methylopila jiangsuensis]|uniref:Acetoacetate metabolism regulatory protein AtoC n=1 Tax=Methylopila jiangsuensis TaxID=586230 RepID=A0A9W6JER9_9HYPH|nr:sigma-54 dependent transcriptional regulator [Methylopila jiangsuensis]MDR6287362.1 DNA-binding NtrC family response regulator [Methylopila jiangsuensis]GLK74943.1 acetoacetate metabolism regulatory protein AtoC [Methylopila jiangsuensis]